MTDTVLRIPQVRELVGGLSKSWIYQEIAEGRFPTPIKLGGRAVGWLRSELDAWLSDRVERTRRPTEDAARVRP
jgi:prophage regulatory protein